jgi:DNA-binding MarR family transcriptional regulator
MKGKREEAVFVEMWRTADLLSRGAIHVLKAEDLSSTQYNVLRILRGSPEGLTCGEIGNRMITRDPDVTRLADRLEKRGLVSRCREEEDRRAVKVRITPKGLEALKRMDGPILEIHHKQLSHLGLKRLKELSELLAQARSAVEAASR